MLGNHAPRHCGLATFTSHLQTAFNEACPDLDAFVLAMNDPGMRYAYPPQVRFELPEADRSAYEQAAHRLNTEGVDLLNVQHEYGIYGGRAGEYLLSLLRGLRMPIVTTLHTILPRPDADQLAVMNELTGLSQRVVVMSAHGADILRDVHGVPEGKIDFIPHGIPSIPFAQHDKGKLGVAGKNLLLTFGLLSPDKGIEYVIDAMPAVLAEFPETVYLVLGATHPHLRAQQGEAYREMLQDRAERLGVASHVILDNRFVSQEELNETLGAADIYITPYLKEEQSTSGTLAYAVGCGKAVISTPYLYAKELLAEERGLLVPWRDPSAMAREIQSLLGDQAKRLGLRQRAAAYGRTMSWPAVARSYRLSFERACSEFAAAHPTRFQLLSPAVPVVERTRPKADPLSQSATKPAALALSARNQVAVGRDVGSFAHPSAPRKGLTTRLRQLSETAKLEGLLQDEREEPVVNQTPDPVQVSLGLVAKSPIMSNLLDLARRVAKVDATILITGESGAGKEQLARFIHEKSDRAAGPFVAVNCGAINETLFESELFGHSRGAFTGATQERPGLFEAANHGTLLLDEIGEVSLAMQVKLLRAIQEREIRRVGENKSRPIDVRILAATNRNLAKDVEAGGFRQDLFYRLKVVELPVPALRERKADILPLARFLLANIARRMNRKVTGLAPLAANRLAHYAWPGNVRELANAMERAVAFAANDRVEYEDLPQEILLGPIGALTQENLVFPRLDSVRPLPEIEREYILAALAFNAGNQTRTADQLQIGAATLYRKLKSYGQIIKERPVKEAPACPAGFPSAS
jgi:DNA-binding NtrC family response regulator/glycosyltransferase involved in cell wall biosynthesis